MVLTPFQTLAVIACVMAGTLVTRFLPFAVFPESKKPPQFILYLSDVLPCAVIGFLVVYCLKGVSLSAAPHGLPELIALAAIALLHKLRGNTLLSIAGGTVVYMLLVQLVF